MMPNNELFHNTSPFRSKNSTKNQRKHAKDQYYTNLFSQSRPSVVRAQARASLERQVARPFTPQKSGRTLFDDVYDQELEQPTFHQPKDQYFSDRNERPPSTPNLYEDIQESSSDIAKEEFDIAKHECKMDQSSFRSREDVQQQNQDLHRLRPLVDDVLDFLSKGLNTRDKSPRECTIFIEDALAKITEISSLSKLHNRFQRTKQHKTYLFYRQEAQTTLEQFLEDESIKPTLRLLIIRTMLTLFHDTDDWGKHMLSNQVEAGSAIQRVCKTAFKLGKNKSLDVEFRTSTVLDCLMNVLPPVRNINIDWMSHRVPLYPILLYAVGTIKFLSSSTANQRYLAQKQLIKRLSTLIFVLTNCVDSCDGEQQFNDEIINVLVQCIATLRNLALDKRHLSMFTDCNVMQRISHMVDVCGHENNELNNNCARLLSKLSTHQDGRKSIMCDERAPFTIAKLMSLNGNKRNASSRVLRSCFVVGNLIAGNSQNRQAFGIAEIIDALLASLHYWTKSLKRQKDPNENKQEKTKLNPTFPLDETMDILAKVCRAIANLGLEASFAQKLSCKPEIKSLGVILKVICNDKNASISEELAFNALATVTNLSYFSCSECDEKDYIWKSREKFSPLLIDFLLSGGQSVDCMHEAVRVLGNFSRNESMHEFLVQRNAEKVMVILLDHCHLDIVYDACGVLVNLSCAEATKSSLLENEQEGMRKLMDNFVESKDEYPQLASLICKILYNIEMAHQNTKESKCSDIALEHCGLREELMDILGECDEIELCELLVQTIEKLDSISQLDVAELLQ